MHYILDTLGNSGPVSNVHFRWTWGFLGLYSGPESGCSWVCILGILGLYSGCSRGEHFMCTQGVFGVCSGCTLGFSGCALGVFGEYISCVLGVFSGCTPGVHFRSLFAQFPFIIHYLFSRPTRAPTAIYFHYLPAPFTPFVVKTVEQQKPLTSIANIIISLLLLTPSPLLKYSALYVL